MTKIGLFSLLLLAGFGIIIGLGSYTFHHAKGTSYFSTDPAACVNCHVMRDQYESWNHSSHRNWAGCSDCHMPHSFFNKYYTKALNGWNHSVKFTTGNFPDPILINDRNRKIAMENCLYCHSNVVSEMNLHGVESEDIGCTRCHGNVGHQGRD